MKENEMQITLHALQYRVTPLQLEKAAEKMMAELEKEMPGMPAFIEELIDRRKRIEESLIALAVELGKTLETLHENFDDYINAARAWGRYGWTLSPCVRPLLFFKPPVSQVCANKEMRAFYNSQSIKKMWELTIPIARNNDIAEAKSCFYHKEYKACALIIAAQIEALLIRNQPRNSNRRHTKKAVEKFCNVHKSELERQRIQYRALCYATLIEALDVLYSSSDNFRKQPNVINRHFLMHGMLTRPVKRMECIQLLLIYYNLLEFT